MPSEHRQIESGLILSSGVHWANGLVDISYDYQNALGRSEDDSTAGTESKSTKNLDAGDMRRVADVNRRFGLATTQLEAQRLSYICILYYCIYHVLCVGLHHEVNTGCMAGAGCPT